MARFVDLLRMSVPSIIVVKKDRWESMASKSGARHFVDLLTNQSKKREIQIRVLEQDAITGTFLDLPPISQPLITGVSRFWFDSEIISQPPSRLCKCGKRSVLSTFALPVFCLNSSGVL